MSGPHQDADSVDLAIIGAGAAGLMAAIWAGRSAREAGITPRIVALDGAAKLGAKILVAGGGRCNVTHHEVDAAAYAGGSRNAIRKVIRRFDVPQTVEFFRRLGVELKREDTGKLFPVTDSARTVLDALLSAAQSVGVDLRTRHRVDSIERNGDGFVIRAPDNASDWPNWGELRAKRVIIACGGMSLPKTGSDGHGYRFVKSLGHTVTPRVFPSLVPLTLPEDHWARTLAGVATDATLEVRTSTNKRLASFTNALLFTHFGISGPVTLDISRYYLDEASSGGAKLVANWLPGETAETVDAALLELGGRSVHRWLSEKLPDRLARQLIELAGLDIAATGATLTREKRRLLVQTLTALELAVTGSRGFRHAEVTAGGVPLTEVRLETMESRVVPSLHLVGEILDVDGRIGGFNFQWAWATGFIAGSGIDWLATPRSNAEASSKLHCDTDDVSVRTDHG